MARLLKVSRSGFYAWATRKQERLAGNNPKQQHSDKIDQAIFLDLGRLQTKPMAPLGSPLPWQMSTVSH